VALVWGLEGLPWAMGWDLEIIWDMVVPTWDMAVPTWDMVVLAWDMVALAWGIVAIVWDMGHLAWGQGMDHQAWDTMGHLS